MKIEQVHFHYRGATVYLTKSNIHIILQRQHRMGLFLIQDNLLKPRYPGRERMYGEAALFRSIASGQLSFSIISMAFLPY